jgi:hypothetical protein
MLLVFPNAPSY